MNRKQLTLDYDRRKEVEDFDKTKLGVKGLVDSGIAKIPRIFHHPPDTLSELQADHEDGLDHLIPVIDLSGPHPEVVEQLRKASAKFGFFQVINHGAAVSLLDRLLGAIKAFHELPSEEKIQNYGRESIGSGKGVGFHSNYDLFNSKAASWRDTFQARLSPIPFHPNDIPDICRDEVIEWDKEVKQLGDRLMGLLSEGLGLSEDRLKGMSYLGRIGMAGHYYPYCPEPNKTIGIVAHTDPGILTVLLQDQVGGLQVKYENKWIDLKPVHGALVINIGDLLQIISNDEYKSGEHRVCANPYTEPRVSVAVFFSPGIQEDLYGPLPELVSSEKPVLYRQLKFSDLLTRFLVSWELGKMEKTQKLRGPMIIAMKGHPGTGKSTIAAAIAASVPCPLIDKDDIRDATLSLSSNVNSAALNDLSYDAMWRVVSTQVRLGLSVVVDSPLSRRRHLDTALRIASGSHRVVVVECAPGDQAEWRRRVEMRGAEDGGLWHKPATWQDLERLLEGYDGCTEYDVGGVPKLIVDTTSGGVDGILSSVVEFIQSHRGNYSL